MILSIDPSSTRTGWAVMSDEDTIVDKGAIRMDSKTPVGERIMPATVALRGLADFHGVTDIVVEVPSGKVAAKSKDSMGNGLTTYGFAAGAIFGVLVETCGADVHSVNEREWTNNVPKKKRAAWIDAAFAGQYTSKGDGGRDIADAIGLGAWWLRRQRFEQGHRDGDQ